MKNSAKLAMAVAFLVMGMEQVGKAQPNPGDGGGGTNGPAAAPDPRRNAVKYMNQTFGLIDTNNAAQTDSNLYNACLSFPATGAGARLQIESYGSNAIIIKASGFDFSAESNRDFALVIC